VLNSNGLWGYCSDSKSSDQSQEEKEDEVVPYSKTRWVRCFVDSECHVLGLNVPCRFKKNDRWGYCSASENVPSQHLPQHPRCYVDSECRVIGLKGSCHFKKGDLWGYCR
jgi:hypothetical protein